MPTPETPPDGTYGRFFLVALAINAAKLSIEALAG